MLWLAFLMAETQTSAYLGRFLKESSSSWPWPPWSGLWYNWGETHSCCGRCSCPLPGFPPDVPHTSCLSVFPSLRYSSKRYPPPPPPPSLSWRWGSSAGVGPRYRPPPPPKLARGPTEKNKNKMVFRSQFLHLEPLMCVKKRTYCVVAKTRCPKGFGYCRLRICRWSK